MEVNEGNSSDKIFYEEQVSESCLNQISLSDASKLSSLMLSLMLENGWHTSLPMKVFCTKSQDKIPIRGEGCNTLGVCHHLSNGFELKHAMLSGDEGVKIKSTRVSSNLNLDNTPLLTCGPLLRLYKSNVKHVYFMYITSTYIHLDQWKSFMSLESRSHMKW